MASRTDADTIADYTRKIAWETEDLRLNADTVLNGVKSAFDDCKHGFYVVAVQNENVIGCLMVTYEWSDWRNGVQWWLQSVYIHPKYRRGGIFSAMYEFILGKASEKKDVRGIRLYVDKTNKIAQKTYEALGMKQANYLVYEHAIVDS